MFDPGPHARAFAALPDDVPALCRAVHNVLLHDFTGTLLHPEVMDRLRGASRRTLPVSDRLDAVMAALDAGLDVARPPQLRSIGTCRDFALLLAALLRHQGYQARVRCGFAQYFSPPRFEDHWICQYRRHADMPWRWADPQLDAAHLDHYAISFDPTDLPPGAFVLPWQVWIAHRTDPDALALYGHGPARGAYFVAVNLARDMGALEDCLTSPLDGWRSASAADFDEAAAHAAGTMAEAARQERPCAMGQPFWDHPITPP